MGRGSGQEGLRTPPEVWGPVGDMQVTPGGLWLSLASNSNSLKDLKRTTLAHGEELTAGLYSVSSKNRALSRCRGSCWLI